MRVVSIVGARPQFVKLAVVARAFASFADITHEIIHTGQHYDDEMSGSFFRDLAIPAPAYNLEVGSSSHANQTAEIMRRLEPILREVNPEWVILYGDTNSTIASAVTASKMSCKLAHVEAGLRSFNRAMPEEINRVVADHLSHLLFCPTETAMANLVREGLGEQAVLCGDVMYDAVCDYVRDLEGTDPSSELPWAERSYALATIHRAENTDDRERLKSLLASLQQVSREVCPVVLAVHPRTKKAMEELRWDASALQLVPPLAYKQMLLCQKHARMILTDSGGIQKEAYFLKVPCITLRNETEWVETLENDCNILVNPSHADEMREAVQRTLKAGPWGSHYGNADAGKIIARAIAATRVDPALKTHQGSAAPLASFAN